MTSPLSSPLLLLLGSLLPAMTLAATTKKRPTGGASWSAPADFLVRGLEEIEPAFAAFDGKMYAGRIPVDRERTDRGEFQFWLFAPTTPLVDDTLMLWFNGGPGCSSFGAGVLFEHSPVTIAPQKGGYCCTDPDMPLQANPHSWARATHMLYVEQPAHTGFSTGVVPQTEDNVATDMVDWIANFYAVFADLVEYDLFVFGESYAGMYVPSVARGFYLENERRKQQEDQDLPLIPLKGIGIGNGVIDAKAQSPAVIDFAYWHGMIDMATRDYLNGQWDQCYQSAVKGSPLSSNPLDLFHPFTSSDECGFLDAVLTAAGDGSLKDMAPDMYDVTTWDAHPVFNQKATIDRFYNNPKVQELLHAPVGTTWKACQGAGLHMLAQDRPISMLPYIAELLDDAQIQVLIYNGDLDISCNSQGSEAALNSMQWSHADEWYHSNRTLWVNQELGYHEATNEEPLSPKVAGYVKEVDRLHFVIVRNSGHLVPYNVPANGLDLVTRFLSGTSLGDLALPNFPLQAAIAEGIHSPADFRNGHHRSSSSFSPLVVNVIVAGMAFLAGVGFSSWRRRKGYQQVPSAALTV